MNSLKKNQVIIFVIAIMLVTAGYLNFTANNMDNDTVLTSMEVNVIEEASIGDARLVNANVIDSNNSDNVNNDDNDNTENESIDVSSKEDDEYFISSKLTRDTMYSQMIESYEKILANENISNEQKNVAQEEIKNINNVKNQIMICENLISTKGIEDSVIFVNGDSVNVIIKKNEINKDEIAQVQNIITREMKIEVGNIHISNR